MRTRDTDAGRTLAKLAVKSTHSKSCPILWRNSSTCGRFSTYTCGGRRQELSVTGARDSLGLRRSCQGARPPVARPRRDFQKLALGSASLCGQPSHMPSTVLRVFGASERSTAVSCSVEVTHPCAMLVLAELVPMWTQATGEVPSFWTSRTSCGLQL